MENHAFALSVAAAFNGERGAKGVNGFYAHAVEANRLLERFGVVLAAGVDFRCHIHHFAEGYAAAVVGHGYRPSGTDSVDPDFYLFAEAHHEFIDGVVQHFFQQHINAIVGGSAVAEFAYVHARAEADVLAPVEGCYVVLGVACRGRIVFGFGVFYVEVKFHCRLCGCVCDAVLANIRISVGIIRG